MLVESQLPKRFWAEALSTATYLRNRSPTTALDDVTPYEAWTGEKPNVEHLKVFGCTAYAHIPKDERKKLDPKARKCIMLGYSSEVKGYRLFNPETQRILYSRDVIFNESKFYYKEKTQENNEVETSKESKQLVVQLEVSEEEEKENEENDSNPGEIKEHRPVRNKNAPERYGEWIYTAAEVEPKEPKSYEEAMKDEANKKWTEAMKTELKSEI
jgi:FtsZ-interacting cell division protein YlmF